MNKIIVRFIMMLGLVVIYFTVLRDNRLIFSTTQDGERIGNTNFYYKAFDRLKIINGKNGTVAVIDKNGESPRSDYADYFSDVATIYHNKKIFIITHAHTTGSGGYDEHQVFKIFNDRIAYLGEHISCDRDVKIVGNRIVFSQYGYHCEYFDFMERDGDITTSTIDLD